MRFRRLGRTEIEVSEVCLGCWALAGGGTWGEQDRDESRRTIEAALDAGVNFFDTAEGYGGGESERLLGEVLAGRRGEVVIATKVSPRHLRAEAVPAACEGSLRRLRTDYIDLYQVHWPDPEVPLEETLSALERLREEGKVRAIGVSNFGGTYLREVLPREVIQSDQVCYNLLFRAVEYAVQPLCVEAGVSILPYSPLAQGLLTGKFRSAEEVPPGRARTRHYSSGRSEARHREAGCEEALFAALERLRGICRRIGRPMGQVALAWLLAREGVASVVAGARHPRQARENAAAADIDLAPELVEELARATDQVKAALGPNIDPWQSDSRADRRGG